MHCNGKCQMMKKMQEEEKKEQQSAEHRFEIQMAVLYSKSFYCTVTGPLTIVEKAFSHEIFCPMKDISLDVFHPPQA